MIDQLIHRIKLRQLELQKSLAQGNPASWDMYQRMVGEYQGLQSSLDMLEQMMDEEDSD
jgi:hypothetical protein